MAAEIESRKGVGVPDIARLISLYESGDSNAGEVLGQIVRRALRRRMHRFAVGPQESEELVQESLLQVFASLAEYDSDRGSFDGWVCGFAQNTLRAHRRKEFKHRASSLPIEEAEAFGYEIPLIESERETLREAMASLDPLDRELLHMKFSLGMSSDEIALSSDLNAPQVRKRISRAMERLRRNSELRKALF